MNAMSQEADELAADPAIIDAWVRGWASSREAPPPIPIPGGLRVDVGQPQQRVRYVFPRLDALALQAVIERESEPGAFIKICATAASVKPLLPDHWTLQEPCYVMTVSLETGSQDARSRVPSSYVISIRRRAAVAFVEILTKDGNLAAKGQMAFNGRYGIADQIVTAPEHRRRGLATVVMRTLEREAASTGVTTGILVATQDGFGLYSALGWNLHSHYTSAALLPLAV